MLVFLFLVFCICRVVMESVGGQKQAAKSVASTSQVLEFFWCFCYSKRVVNGFAQQVWAWGGKRSWASLLPLWGGQNSSQPWDAPGSLANHACCSLKNDLCKTNDFPYKDMTVLWFAVPLFKLSQWFYLGLQQSKCYSWLSCLWSLLLFSRNPTLECYLRSRFFCVPRIAVI